MQKVVNLIVLCIFIINMTGCATILKDKETKMPVNSEPQGADVFLGSGKNQVRVGRTPTIVKLYNKEPAYLTFRKDGYEDSVYEAKPWINNGWMFASFTCLIVPALVDFISHNTYSFKEKEIKIILDPVILKQANQINTKK